MYDVEYSVQYTVHDIIIQYTTHSTVHIIIHYMKYDVRNIKYNIININYNIRKCVMCLSSFHRITIVRVKRNGNCDSQFLISNPISILISNVLLGSGRAIFMQKRGKGGLEKYQRYVGDFGRKRGLFAATMRGTSNAPIIKWHVFDKKEYTILLLSNKAE